jgi:GAF domain-containing protein
VRSAQHAAEVFKVPFATITLTDSGIRVGYDRTRASNEAESSYLSLPSCPDDVSAVMVAEGRPLSCEDLVRDARFTDATIHQGQGLRFLAGTPLTLGSDEVVGTLCLFDHAPRPLADDEISLLARLGRELLAPLAAALTEVRRASTMANAGSLRPDPAPSWHCN